ncbi:DMT family transporter [Risungbinella massiliensis]|uniref:DMT family transporter n=1 Tax=Risungbinella massiliensis TaxID=1329796 RepID=UPI0005CBA507|nr:EamA family transporter [Risungbinella massiliensis]
MKNTGLYWGLFLIICLVNGTTWGAQKIGLQGSLPLWSASMRFLIAGFTVGIILIVMRKWDFKIEYLKIAFLYGVFYFSLPFGIVYWATQYLSSGIISVLASTISISLLIIEYFYEKKHISLNQFIGAALSFVGLVVLLWNQLQVDASWISFVAMIFVILGMIATAIITIVVRPTLSKVSILNLNSVAMLIAGMALFITSLLFEQGARSFSGVSLTSLLYLSFVGSSITIAIYMYLIKNWDASKASGHLFISPIIALYLGHVIFNEKLGSTIYVGTAIILLGVILVNISLPASKNKDNAIIWETQNNKSGQ